MSRKREIAQVWSEIYLGEFGGPVCVGKLEELRIWMRDAHPLELVNLLRVAREHGERLQ